MVYAVFLLFTVSTLAAHIHAVPTGELHNGVQHACEGETLCDIKPENYPHEEIDRFVAQNLHHLHRMKRQAGYVPIEIPSINNCVAESEQKKFFTVRPESGAAEPIIQSGLFEQTIPTVVCHNQEAMCFEDIDNDIEFNCETVTTTFYFLVLAKGEAKFRETEIATDCMCTRKNY